MKEQGYLEILNKAREFYYRNGASTLSDEEYDKLIDEFKSKYPNHPFFKEVGAEEKNEHWKKVEHEYPLGSLNKVNNTEDLENWISKQPIAEFVLEEKMDGHSIDLKYKSGRFFSAVTRGNGLIGDDITRNVAKMKYVPLDVKIWKRDVTLRAEIIMTKTDFERLPEELMMQNPRNASVGISKKLDGKYCEYLSVIITAILSRNEERSNLHLLEELGFRPVTQWGIIKKVKEIINIYQKYIDSQRAELDYDIDGLVIKSNEVLDDEWEHPKHQMAFKFPNQYKATILRDVIWQYNGNRMSPVGIFDPIELCGATVSKATLNNIELIEDMGLKIGAKIEVTRANEVIPKIQSILENGNVEIKPPTNCPICNSEVIKKGKYFYCSNEDCDSKVTRKVLKWLENHSSKGVAAETINLLFEYDLFNSLPEFLSIPEDEEKVRYIRNDIPGFGERKCEILIAEIIKTRNCTTLEFLDGLDFPDMGTRKWQSIIDYFANNPPHQICIERGFIAIITILNTIKEGFDLKLINGIAEETNRKIHENLNKNWDLIIELLYIVKVENYQLPKKEEKKMSGKLEGKSFCITGKFPSGMKREKAEEIIRENGGTVKDSVKKGLSFLITEDRETGTKKNLAAAEFNIPIINEAQFFDMVK